MLLSSAQTMDHYLESRAPQTEAILAVHQGGEKVEVPHRSLLDEVVVPEIRFVKLIERLDLCQSRHEYDLSNCECDLSLRFQPLLLLLYLTQ